MNRMHLARLVVGGLALTFAIGTVHASDSDDLKAVAALDTQYQKAVKENDAKTMAAILTDDFILVEGNGKRATKADLLTSATDGKTHYEHQEDTEQTVMVAPLFWTGFFAASPCFEALRSADATRERGPSGIDSRGSRDC